MDLPAGKVLPIVTGASSDPQGAVGFMAVGAAPAPPVPTIAAPPLAPEAPIAAPAPAATQVAEAPAAPVGAPLATWDGNPDSSADAAAEQPAPVDKIAVARAALLAAGLPTDVIDGTAPVTPVLAPAAPGALATAAMATVKAPFTLASWANRVLTSTRTLLFFAVTATLGVLDSLGTVDISGLVADLFGTTRIKPGDVMLLMSVTGALLRLVTTTPVFARWRAAARGGGGSDSRVDDPK